MSKLIAKFHLMSYTHLLIMLNGSKHRPEGLCQLLTIMAGRFDTKLIKTFRSNVLPAIKCLSKVVYCLASVILLTVTASNRILTASVLWSSLYLDCHAS